MSLEHYIHCLDWLLHTVLASAPALAPTRHQLALAGGFAPSTTHRWLQKKGTAALVEALYHGRFPLRTLPETGPSPDSFPSLEETGLEFFALTAENWIRRIWTMVYRHEVEHVPLYVAAADAALPVFAAEQMYAQARWIRDLRTPRGSDGYRHRMEEWVPDRREPEKKLRLSCPRQLPPVDVPAVEWLAPRLFSVMRADSLRVQAVVDHYVSQVWQTRSLLWFKDPQKPQRAQEYLWFLEALGFSREQIRFATFAPTPLQRELAEWQQALPWWPDQIEMRRHPNRNNSGATRWLGIAPGWVGEHTNVPQENAKGLYGYRYCLVMASIFLAGITASPDGAEEIMRSSAPEPTRE